MIINNYQSKLIFLKILLRKKTQKIKFLNLNDNLIHLANLVKQKQQNNNNYKKYLIKLINLILLKLKKFQRNKIKGEIQDYKIIN